MIRSKRPTHVVIATPAWADANNGNWQTARRWARHLAGSSIVQLIDQWPDGQVLTVSGPREARSDQADVLIALHARRSAPSIQAWHAARGAAGLAVVLTGTDLYKDWPTERGAIPEAGTEATPGAERNASRCAQGNIRQGPVHRSLLAAQALVVLQDQALRDLPDDCRAKTRVIFQSATPRQALPKPLKAGQALRALMVGHLREEKDPATLQRAARLLGAQDHIRIDHIGAALEPHFAQQAEETQAAHPHYRWLGAQSHEQSRRRIQRAHVLVHTSRMEGGAHVLMEALQSGTPVLASRMAGNVGMLGRDYAGYFEVGDAPGLVQALRRFRSDAAFRARLQAQCAQRAPLFDPVHEAASLRQLVHDLQPG